MDCASAIGCVGVEGIDVEAYVGGNLATGWRHRSGGIDICLRKGMECWLEAA